MVLCVGCLGESVLYVCIEYHIRVDMYHVSAQSVDESMINVHYYYLPCKIETDLWTRDLLRSEEKKLHSLDSKAIKLALGIPVHATNWGIKRSRHPST